jgi:hypothetical protein
MPHGDKSSYTDKQKRKAAHIEQSYEEKGVKPDEAEARAWATVNKQDGGGKKSGSGRSKSRARNMKKAGDCAPAFLFVQRVRIRRPSTPGPPSRPCPG